MTSVHLSAARDQRISPAADSDSLCSQSARTGARPKAERAGEGGASVASEAAGTAALDSTLTYTGGQAQSGSDELFSRVDAGERRRVRWAARAVLWQASTLKNVRQCGRVLAEPDGVPATVAGLKRRELDSGAVAGYSGVQLCGSVWACPRCSAVIAQRRSEEISRAVAACHAAGGHVFLVTMTLRHRRGDDLSALWDGLSAGWAAAFSSDAWRSRPGRFRTHRGREIWEDPRLGDGERFGVAGRVRSTEATVSLPGSGGHGWHVHVHALLFTLGCLGVGLRPDLEAVLGAAAWDRDGLGRVVFASRIFSRFARAVERRGLSAPLADGFDIREVHDGGAEFVGSYLSKSTYDVATRLGAEIAAGSQTKISRSGRNFAPFEVLARCADDLDSRRFGLRTPLHWEVVEVDSGLAVLDRDTGELTAFTAPGLWGLWHAWERASLGRRQVVWSRALSDFSDRAALWDLIIEARGQVEDDHDIAQRELVGDFLGDVSRDSWYRRLVWRPSWLVGGLEAAEAGGVEGAAQFFAARGVTFIAAED